MRSEPPEASLEALRLRPATLADEPLLLAWVNDPAVRASAFRGARVGAEEHARWLRERLEDPCSVLLIGEDLGGQPVGQVRFDLHGEEAEIDVSIDRARRGRHLGAALIRAAVEELARRRRVRIVHAHIRPENHASIRAFQGAGFADAGAAAVEGIPCAHLVWRGPR